MNAKAKKIIKICCWIIGLVILIPIVLIASLPLWLGPVVRPTVNTIAPKITKTDFRLEKLYLNPYTCNFELGGVRIGNPAGFSDTNAVVLGYFNVDVDTSSLSKDVIVVENVEISDIYVTMLKGDDGKTNLDIIEENVMGAADEYEKEQEKAKAADEEPMEFNKKIIVNRFVFKNVSGKISMSKYVTVPFRVPSIELKDIGKDSGGYDLDHLYAAIVKEFWASIMAQAADVGDLLGKGAGKAVDAVKGAGESIKNAGESLKNVGDSFKNLFKKN